MYSVWYHSFFSDFNGNLIFSTDFRKILKNKTSRKSFKWEMSRCVRTDRDDGAYIHFSQFCEKRLKMRRLVQKVSSKMKEKRINFETRRNKDAK